MTHNDRMGSMSDRGKFRFYYARDPQNRCHAALEVIYREVKIELMWPEGEEGRSDLDLVIDGLKRMLDTAQAERSIEDEVRSIPAEYDALLRDEQK